MARETIKFTRKDMRARFHELRTQKADIEAQAEPLRTQYDDLRNKNRADEKVLADQVRAITEPLTEIGEEMSMLVKALGRFTGSDADDPRESATPEPAPAPAPEPEPAPQPEP